MLKPAEFYQLLTTHSIHLFTGVPDSLLKDFCTYIDQHTPPHSHIITANEGQAIALAAGYYLATEEIALVYMQNSGLGHAINPLTSLTDPLVYRIPVLLLIGWRGEPGLEDEPQHRKKGAITLDLLEALGLNYSILPPSLDEAEEVVKRALDSMRREEAPYAFVVKKKTFAPFQRREESPLFSCSREEAIGLILSMIDPDSILLSTTGGISRELFSLREERGEGHEKDFLVIGSMGHASQIALGIALKRPTREIYCLDGDGSLLMHMGGLVTIGAISPPHFKHILLNNGAHDSVGGQRTPALNMDMEALGKACGYKRVLVATTREEIVKEMRVLNSCVGPALLEIKVKRGSRKDLGRPTETPLEIKRAFMEYLKEGGSYNASSTP